MVSLVTACILICFLEIKRYQTSIVLKGVTYVVFVLRSLLHWCFYVLKLYSKPVPVWLSVWFLPLEQMSFVSLRAPAIQYAYSLALAIRFFDISIDRYTPRSHRIDISKHCITLKFDKCISSIVAKTPVKFQRDQNILNVNLIWDRLTS